MPTVIQTTIFTAENRISPVLKQIGTDSGLLSEKMQADFGLAVKSVDSLNARLGVTKEAISTTMSQSATATQQASGSMDASLGRVETRANQAAGSLRGTAKASGELKTGLTSAAGGADTLVTSFGDLQKVTGSLIAKLDVFSQQLTFANQRVANIEPLVARTGATNDLTAATTRAAVAQRELASAPRVAPMASEQVSGQAAYDFRRGARITQARPTTALYQGAVGVQRGAQTAGLVTAGVSAFGLYEASQFFKGGVATAASANLSPAVEKAMENAVLKLYQKVPVGFPALFQMFQAAAETFQQGAKQSPAQYMKEITQIVMAGLRSAVGTGAQQPEVISQALARVLHGFSIASDKAEKTMDILHSVAAFSGAGIRVETLAQNMSRSSAMAPIVGISLPQWGALYAELSKQFRPQQTDTLLRQLEQNIRTGTTTGAGTSFMRALGLTKQESQYPGMGKLPVDLWSTAGIKKYGIFNVIEMLQQAMGKVIAGGFLSPSDVQKGLARMAPQLRGGAALAYLLTPGRLGEARQLGTRLGAEQGPILPGGLGTGYVGKDVAGVTARYFNEMMKQPGAQLSLAWHSMVTTAITLGTTLAPAAERAAKQLERLAAFIEPIIKAHPAETSKAAEIGIGALISSYFLKTGLGAVKTFGNLGLGIAGLFGIRAGAGAAAGAGGGAAAEGGAGLSVAGAAGAGLGIAALLATGIVADFKGYQFAQATEKAGLGAAISDWWKSNVINKILTVVGLATPFGIQAGIGGVSKAGGPGAVMGDVGSWIADQNSKLNAFFGRLPGMAAAGFGQLTSAIGDQLGRAGHLIDATLADWVAMAGHELGQLGNALNMNAVVNTISGLVGALQKTFSGIQSAIQTALNGIQSAIQNRAGQIGSALAHALGLDDLKRQVEQAWPQIEQAFSAGQAALGTIIQNLWSKSKLGTVPAWGHELMALPGQIASAWDKSGIKAALDHVGHLYDSFTQGAADKIGAFKDLSVKIIGGWSNSLDHVSGVGIGKFLANVTKGMGEALGKFGTFIGKSLSNLGGWADKATGEGKSFIDKLIAGIQDKAGALKDAILKPFKDAFDWIGHHIPGTGDGGTGSASRSSSTQVGRIQTHAMAASGPGGPRATPWNYATYNLQPGNTGMVSFMPSATYAGTLGGPRASGSNQPPAGHSGQASGPPVTVRIAAGPSTTVNPTGTMVWSSGQPSPLFTVTAPVVHPPKTARVPSYGGPYTGDLGPFAVGPTGRASFGEEPGVLTAYEKFIASVEKLPKDLQGYMEKAAQTFRTSLNTEEALHNKNLGTLTATYNARAQGYYQQYNQNVSRIVSTGQEASLYQATRVNISMSRANQLAIVSAQTLEGNHAQQIATLKRQRTEAMNAAGGKTANVQYPWMTAPSSSAKTPAQIWQDFQNRINDANSTYTRSMHALEQRLGITGTAQAKGFEAWLSHQDFSSKTRMSTAWDTYQRELKSLRLAYYGPDDKSGSIGREDTRHNKVIDKLTKDLEKASKPAEQWKTVTSSVATALKTRGDALNYALLTGAGTMKDVAQIVRASIAQARLDLVSDRGTLLTQQALANSGKYLGLKETQALVTQETDNAKSRQQIGINARELNDPNYMFALANQQRYGATAALQGAQKQLGIDQLLAGNQKYLDTLVETTKVTAQDNVLIGQRTLLTDQMLNADQGYLDSLVQSQKLTEEDNLVVSKRNLLIQQTLSLDSQHIQTVVDQTKIDAASALVKQQESNTVQSLLLSDKQYLAIQAATQLAQVKGNILSQQQSAILTSILSQSKEYVSSLVELGRATLIAAVAQDGLNLTVAGLSMDLGGNGSAVSSAIGHVTTLWQQAVQAGAGYVNQFSGALVQAYQEQEKVNDANNRSNIVVGLLTGNLASLSSGLQGLFSTANDKITFWTDALGRSAEGIPIAAGNILDLGKDAIKTAQNLGSLSDVISGLTQVVSSISGAAGTEFMRTGAISPDTIKAYGAANLALTQASWDDVAKALKLASGIGDTQGYIAALGNEIDLYKKKLVDDAAKYGPDSPQVKADQGILQGLIKEWTDLNAAVTQMTSSAEDNAKTVKGFTDAISQATDQLTSDKASLASQLSSDNSNISDAKAQLARDIAEGPERNAQGIVTPAAQETYDNTIRADNKRVSDAQQQYTRDLTDGNKAIKKDTEAVTDSTKAYQDYLDSISNGKKDLQLFTQNGVDPAQQALVGLTTVINASATDLTTSLNSAGQGATDLGTTLSKLGVDLTTLDTGIKGLAQIIADAIKAIGNAIAGLPGGGGGGGPVGEGGGSAEQAAASGGSALTRAYANLPSLTTIAGTGSGTGTTFSSISGGIKPIGSIGTTSPLISAANRLPQTFTGSITGTQSTNEVGGNGTTSTASGSYRKVVNDDGSVSYVWVPTYQSPTTAPSPSTTGTGYNGLTGYVSSLPSIGSATGTWGGSTPTEQSYMDSLLGTLPSISSGGGTWAGLTHTETDYLGQQSYYPSLPSPVSPPSGKDPTSLLSQIADNTGTTATNTNAINNMDPAAVATELRNLLQNLINVAPAQSAIRIGNVQAGIDQLIDELGTTTTSQNI